MTLYDDSVDPCDAAHSDIDAGAAMLDVTVTVNVAS